MRLIDADALKKKIITTLCDFIACGNCPFYEETCLVGDWIDDAPTIDAVPQEEVVEIKKNYIDEISGLLNRIDELTIEKCDIPHETKPTTDAIEDGCELVDGLERLLFFNQRAGRELWQDKPKDVQEEDIKSAERILTRAINALSVKPPQTDLISRADAIEATQAIIGNEASSKAWAILEQIRSLPSAEAKGDLISRQWLLDLYATPKGGEDVEWKVPLEVVQQNIKDAPSAEAEQTIRHIENNTKESDLVYRPSVEAEWSPCSERLPEEDGWYLVTVRGYETVTDVSLYSADGPAWGDVSTKQKVIAWMPLPKPYKGGDDE